MATLYGIVAAIQMVLTLLGWAAWIFAALAFIAGNNDRALQLFIGGLVWFVIKYALGFLFLISARSKKEPSNQNSQNNRYDELVITLQKIKEGVAPIEKKIAVSRSLIDNANLTSSQVHDLHNQVDQVYNSK